MARETINVGILGYGIVGGGLYKVLTDNAQSITQRVGRPVNVVKVADIDWDRPREFDVPPELRTTDASEILEDENIDIVAETIGGIKPALGFVMAAIEAGKSVVTSNKEMIARHGNEILSAAAARSVDVAFEGAVGGVVPVIRTLKESLDADNIHEVMGIVNGTTNYILTQMSQNDMAFETALKQAQELGYAEADPTADVEGIDAANKLAILSALAFGRRVDVSQVYREGISRILPEDIAYARRMGFVVKLLAIGRRTAEDRLEARVHPVLLPNSHALAAVVGSFNAVFIRGEACDDVMLYGRGAGALPTGAAVAGDVLDCARNIVHGASGRTPCACAGEADLVPMGEVRSKVYLRMRVKDQAGVLGTIATIFGSQEVSINSVIQEQSDGKTADIVWIVHECVEDQLTSALKAIESLPIVESIPACIRVEG
ncbi:MAG TPA: homoserine dehydrogenase [Armatimonadetes bacterium]|jgi:homoserine dehydrogenase|nr:homoserine dehydrogenase [Armatimonadota bacterium]